jgi:predicted adenylyl cyclase CyaB
MARNIEIKARIASVEALMPRAMALADGPPERIEQDDTFFDVSRGRLKLRQFADGSAELIHYQREDGPQARASDYARAPVPDAAALREALTRACGQQGQVRKQRWLFRVGATRIHLDRVEGLGDFIELEVVLQPGQDEEAAGRTAQALMHSLGLEQAPRVAVAYLDLLPPSVHRRGTGAN